jgi:DNA-binding CsgD family transcriptional regulator
MRGSPALESGLDTLPVEMTNRSTGTRTTDGAERSQHEREGGDRQTQSDEPRRRSPVPSQILRMIGELVHQVNSDDNRVQREPRGGVILDADVDGVRCLLIRRPPNRPSATIQLSPREREIVRMVAKGYPNKAIAAVLDISSWTVGTHLRHVFAKLGVSSRAAMVARLHEIEGIGPIGGDNTGM